MPTTSNRARTQSAAATDESTPPDIATTMRWPAGSPGRSRSIGRIETHLPEAGLKPRGGGERRTQRREAALAPAPGELLIERGGGRPRKALVVLAGVHLEPVA